MSKCCGSCHVTLDLFQLVAHLAAVFSSRRKLIVGASVPLVLLAVLFVAWGVDSAVQGDRVARNVTADGVAIGGLDEADLDAVASDLEDRLKGQPATLKIGTVLLDTDLYDLGTRVNRDQLKTSALAARGDGSFITAPFRWVGSFFNEVEVPVELEVDDEASSIAAEALIEGQLTQPSEPFFDTDGPELRVVDGVDGATIDPETVPPLLEASLTEGAPYVLDIAPLALRPTLQTDVLQAVADEANEATSQPVGFRVLGSDATIESAQLRSWVELTGADTPTPGWTINGDRAIDELRPLFSSLGDESQQAHFEVVDGRPIIVPASESVVCCEDDTGDRIREGLTGAAAQVAPAVEEEESDEADDEEGEGSTTTAAQPSRIIELMPTVTGSDAGVLELEALGVVEEVATFTTNHSCCQNRVTNIQLMAEIVRGTVVKPGDRFDLNDIVGKRDRARGFLPAGAISEGNLEDQVGGGVSQFTTTMFNAAFFGGMDFIEYQSHSLYFSRYPRGREATISWPKPDFIVENNTPYGILVWPTWTDTSITVTLYSTKHINVEDLGRTERAQGACTRVTTTRERTYPDGESVRDSVFALYRPGEGLDCNGNSTVPTEPETTTTTVEGTETTTETAPTSDTTTGETTPTTAPTSDTTAPPTTAPTTEATPAPTTAATTPSSDTTAAG